LLASVDQPDFPQPRPSDARFVDLLRPHLALPILLVTVLTTLGWLLVLQPVLPSVPGQTGEWIDIEPGPLAFGFLGAYFFGMQMLLRRFVRRDLNVNAYLAFANRILLAMIGVWIAMTAIELLGPPDKSGEGIASAASGSALLVAFAVGAFPRIVWQFLAALGPKIPGFKLVLPSLETKQPLSALDGLTVWHETRLEEEDIENVPNMATADIVDVMLHTQIPAERLVSWVDQSILVTALGVQGDKALGKLRGLGVRTASQLVAGALGEPAEKEALTDVLGKNGLEVLYRALSREPNFEQVSAWRINWQAYQRMVCSADTSIRDRAS
jgi:hypothetical protein